MKVLWPEDPARRAFAIAVVCSILLHILLLASLVWVNTLAVPVYAKRGEPLIVDIAPDKPEEKAPLGNPTLPPVPTPPPPSRAAERPAPKPNIPPAPPPTPPAPAKAPPPRPEPPKQVAKAAPPEPEPKAREAAAPLPSPAPAPSPEPSPQPREAQPAPTSQPAEANRPQPAAPPPSSASSEGAANRTALAKPPSEAPSIFRSPGAGGGLHGGRGGSVGEPIPLDTPDPNYREYMDKVRQRIYAKWGYPYEAQQRGLQGKLVIEFHIAKDGHLQFIELRQTSGQDILDTFAMTAVKLAQMYPPLPDAMQREVLPIVGIFVYTLKSPLSGLQLLQ